MTDSTDIVRLQEQVKTLYRLLDESRKEVNEVRAEINTINSRDRLRVRAGVIALGSIVLTLIGVVSSLLVYIFQKAT